MTMQFNKLSGASNLRKGPIKIDKALDVAARAAFRKEYEASDESSRALMRLEIQLDMATAPGRADRAQKLATLQAETVTLSKCAATLQREVAAMSEQVAVLSAFRERHGGKLSADQMRMQSEVLDMVEGAADAILKALADAGVKGVGEIVKAPFPPTADGPHAGFTSAAAESVSAWAIPPTSAIH